MSVTIRPYVRRGQRRKKVWEVNIRVVLPNGQRVRKRLKSPVPSKSGSQRWGEARERELVVVGLPQESVPAPTLVEFAPRFIDGYARANRHKASGVAAKETILRVHLIPWLGSKRLDQIRPEDVQRLKARLTNKAPKTVNNVLTVLNTLLRVAVEWELISEMPCPVHLIRNVPVRPTPFYECDQFERLVLAAQRVDPRARLVVLLGGEAGLRCGEMMALEWGDVDFERQQLHVRRSEWREVCGTEGFVDTPKGGRGRRLFMTQRLASALRTHRHLISRRILCQPDGESLTRSRMKGLLNRAINAAGLERSSLHMLRHTFCSHLAMKGAPARAIQDLAGHADITTTERYMHLSPGAAESAIRLLDQRGSGEAFGRRDDSKEASST